MDNPGSITNQGSFVELHADLNRHVVLDTRSLAWVDGAAGAAAHKPLALGGGEPPVSTEIVRYPAGAQIREGDAGGAEMLVLAGALGSDPDDLPAGSYIRLPPGWRGQLSCATDCVLFLKRGHLSRRDAQQRMLRPQDRVWHPGLVSGLRVLSLGEFEGAHTALVQWQPGTRFQYHRHYGGEEIFVMEGVFQDEHGDYPAGTWLRSPHLSAHVPFSEPGCLILVKVGHLPAPPDEPPRIPG